MSKLVFWLLVVPGLFVVLIAGAYGLFFLFGNPTAPIIGAGWGVLVALSGLCIYYEKVMD